MITANKPSYKEQIYLQIKKAHREKNAEMVVYYQNALNNSVACVSFDKFKGSWAYTNWMSENINKIEAVESEFNRFAYLD
jgi:hypothetical protein